MGNAVPKNVKARASVLLAERPDNFSDDYGKNKEFIRTLSLPFSKPIINKIAGYITRKKGEEKKE